MKSGYRQSLYTLHLEIWPFSTSKVISVSPQGNFFSMVYLKQGHSPYSQSQDLSLSKLFLTVSMSDKSTVSLSTGWLPQQCTNYFSISLQKVQWLTWGQASCRLMTLLITLSTPLLSSFFLLGLRYLLRAWKSTENMTVPWCRDFLPSPYLFPNPSRYADPENWHYKIYCYFFVSHCEVVPPILMGGDSQVAEGIDDDTIVAVPVVDAVVLVERSQETEASVAQVVVDSPSTRLPPGQQDPVLLHGLHPALFPGVLMFAYDDGGTVPPQKEGGLAHGLHFEHILLQCQVKVDVVAFRVEDAHP